MGVLERKNAIKLSADLAMAFAKKGRTSWSRAVIAKASENNQSTTNYCKILSQRLMIIKKASNLSPKDVKNIRSFRSWKVMKLSYRSRALRKSCTTTSPHNKFLPSSLLAKRLVQKRTQILKSLVPGGDQCLDEVSLIKETLDYILSLRAQVSVMRFTLANATNMNMMSS
ncbi:Myc-type, basic helix-loop-helix (bHLH) domain containing protein [Parasponia andersonii]|uniref:Myc-type, basic helix-loop-helix (BHLH) domain containing protein n=1 Tax=Parasponia andersonii TaxID=3476 RepID=A0A2P5C4U0_PARAD|nr:Myc-type, basic helix-loop-helix (bHLH) domain containing protein [Parasponia andersonii]